LRGGQSYAHLIVEINGNRKKISPHIQLMVGTAAWLAGFLARLRLSEGIGSTRSLIVALLPLG
jgi:hypothetical protein